ncbi:MAG TPA: prepilin-type N-terminal cleavage/methylation domain-containing protein [Verrucomicrobiota bacterium]|nr:prepilin-type N-terminal cleavage/methylation domain-containing protein [Verrucomicrobiota bacterium]
MFIKTASRKRGFTLAEVVIAMAIFGVASIAVMSFYLFSARSTGALANYAILDGKNREGIDTMSQEIRQCQRVASFTTNSITLLNADNSTITYTYYKDTQELVRISSSDRTVIVEDCSYFAFNLNQRNPIGGSYDIYPVATDISTCKVINLTWKTSRRLYGDMFNTENVQTARIVIRKQKLAS